MIRLWQVKAFGLIKGSLDFARDDRKAGRDSFIHIFEIQ